MSFTITNFVQGSRVVHPRPQDELVIEDGNHVLFTLAEPRVDPSEGSREAMYLVR
jgi:hypothetical protein